MRETQLSKARCEYVCGALCGTVGGGGWWLCLCLADKPLEIYKLVTYFISLRAKLI